MSSHENDTKDNVSLTEKSTEQNRTYLKNYDTSNITVIRVFENFEIKLFMCVDSINL